MTACAFRVEPVKAPTSGKVRGYRYVAATVNRAKYSVLMGDYVQSFARPYVIYEEFHGHYREEATERFKETLRSIYKVTRFIDS